MAVNDITLINGVTKTEVENGFEYLFPLAYITTNTSATTVTIRRTSPVQTYTMAYEDIVENYGATTVEEYADALAEGCFFFESKDSDYTTDVAMGRRSNVSLWNKFGYNNDVGIGTEVVASWGGTFTPLTTATTMTISSTSANDTTGGTGCQTIIIYYIDENRDAQILVTSMNGTTDVVTTEQSLGINRVSMYLCGTGQENAGTITVTATTGGSTMAQMPANEGVTQQCIFHVPSGYTFLANFLLINVLNRGKDAELTAKMIVYYPVSNGKQEVFKVDIDTQVTNEPLTIIPQAPFPITEKAIMWLELTSDKANVVVNCRFSGTLNKN